MLPRPSTARVNKTKLPPAASTNELMKQLLLLILLPASYSASCQTTKPAVANPVTLSVAQAAKIEDSLRVLPLVRQEAQQWHLAATAYRHAADSLQRATSAQHDAAQAYQQSLMDQQRLLASETAAKTEWRSKARKRGVLNGLLVALSGVLLGLAVTR